MYLGGGSDADRRLVECVEGGSVFIPAAVTRLITSPSSLLQKKKRERAERPTIETTYRMNDINTSLP